MAKKETTREEFIQQRKLDIDPAGSRKAIMASWPQEKQDDYLDYQDLMTKQGDGVQVATPEEYDKMRSVFNHQGRRHSQRMREQKRGGQQQAAVQQDAQPQGRYSRSAGMGAGGMTMEDIKKY